MFAYAYFCRMLPLLRNALVVFLYISPFTAVYSQDTIPRKANDTVPKKLPFAIAAEKRLSEDDLKDKKEGIYLTGEPDLSSDPETGFGAGAEAQLFFDGKRTDPFFEYTPYRAQLDLSAFLTTKSEKEFEFVWDVPYIFNSKWRLRGRIAYEINPDYLFFGATEKTLQPLSYYDPVKGLVTKASLDDYMNSLTGSSTAYNTFEQKELLTDVTMEHNWLKGKLRSLIGFEYTTDNITTPLNGQSLLYQEALQGIITGCGPDHGTMVQLGLVYDTRDLEADPSSGSFAEATYEISTTVLGSDYNFGRYFIHYNHYERLLKKKFKKLVFAFRAGMGYTSGNAPFYEYLDQWSSEGDINGLGGAQTLRGYAQSRFVAPAMALANVELRYRFWQVSFLDQNLGFYAIPFFDAGGVWDNLNRVTGNLQNIRYSYGPGAQIAWNEDTILRFDLGFCKEGNQFYFGIGQIF
jgi:outer membrane protein assembly factor BamA